jgi:hypothetical protein
VVTTKNSLASVARPIQGRNLPDCQTQGQPELTAGLEDATHFGADRMRCLSRRVVSTVRPRHVSPAKILSSLPVNRRPNVKDSEGRGSSSR